MIYLSRIFKLPSLCAECAHCHIAALRRLFQGYFLTTPCLVNFIEIIRQRQGRPAKADSFCFRCSNTLSLSLADISSLVFCTKDNTCSTMSERNVPSGLCPDGCQARAYPEPQCRCHFPWSAAAIDVGFLHNFCPRRSMLLI